MNTATATNAPDHLIAIVSDDLSIADLRRKETGGFPVFKTPHMGNWYGNNLLYAAAGIRMLTVDWNRCVTDTNFHPHCVIARGCAYRCADTRERVLTPFARIARECLPDFLADHALPYETLNDMHVGVLRRTIPQARIQAYSDYLKIRPALVVEACERCHRMMPRLWGDWINPSGTVSARLHDQVGSFSTHLFGVTNDREGWKIPNEVSIVLDILMEYLDTGRNELYSISGPDMVRYMPKPDYMCALQRLYEALMPMGLPDRITYHLIDSFDVRFATMSSGVARLESLRESLDLMEEFRSVRSAAMRSYPGRKPTHLIAHFDELKRAVDREVECRVAACAEVFYDIYAGKFLSQYDLLLSGESLRVPEWALQTKIRDLKAMYRQLAKFR